MMLGKMPNWQNGNQQNDTWQSQTGQNASQENNTQHCDTWHNDNQLKDTEHNIQLLLIMLSVDYYEFCHTECHDADCCYADCHYEMCLGVLFTLSFNQFILPDLQTGDISVLDIAVKVVP